jgi:hypothetical protein
MKEFLKRHKTKLIVVSTNIFTTLVVLTAGWQFTQAMSVDAYTRGAAHGYKIGGMSGYQAALQQIGEFCQMEQTVHITEDLVFYCRPLTNE